MPSTRFVQLLPNAYKLAAEMHHPFALGVGAVGSGACIAGQVTDTVLAAGIVLHNGW